MPRSNLVNATDVALAVDVSGADVEITVDDASVLPPVPFYLVIDPFNDTGREYCRATAVAGNVLTVDRDLDGSESTTHSAGVFVRISYVAQILDDVWDNFDLYLPLTGGKHMTGGIHFDYPNSNGYATLAMSSGDDRRVAQITVRNEDSSEHIQFNLYAPDDPGFSGGGFTFVGPGVTLFKVDPTTAQLFADLRMNDHKIRAVADPSDAKDVATKGYVDGQDHDHATPIAAHAAIIDVHHARYTDAESIAAGQTHGFWDRADLNEGAPGNGDRQVPVWSLANSKWVATPIAASLRIMGVVPTEADLPVGPHEFGQGWITQDTGDLWIWVDGDPDDLFENAGPLITTSHDALLDVTPDQHHTRYTDAEAVTAVGPHTPAFSALHADLTDVTADQHHARYADAEAVAAGEVHGFWDRVDLNEGSPSNGDRQVPVWSLADSKWVATPIAASLRVMGVVPTEADLPAGPHEYGQGWIVQDTGDLWIWVDGDPDDLFENAGPLITTSHSALLDVTPDQHHARYTDAEAVTAVGPHTPAFSALHADLTDVTADQHHTRYTDAEAVAAVGTPWDGAYLPLAGGTMSGNIYMDAHNIGNIANLDADDITARYFRPEYVFGVGSISISIDTVERMMITDQDSQFFATDGTTLLFNVGDAGCYVGRDLRTDGLIQAIGGIDITGKLEFQSDAYALFVGSASSDATSIRFTSNVNSGLYGSFTEVVSVAHEGWRLATIWSMAEAGSRDEGIFHIRGKSDGPFTYVFSGSGSEGDTFKLTATALKWLGDNHNSLAGSEDTVTLELASLKARIEALEGGA